VLSSFAREASFAGAAVVAGAATRVAASAGLAVSAACPQAIPETSRRVNRHRIQTSKDNDCHKQ
jgi:hypothetical protein